MNRQFFIYIEVSALNRKKEYTGTEYLFLVSRKKLRDCNKFVLFLFKHLNDG